MVLLYNYLGESFTKININMEYKTDLTYENSYYKLMQKKSIETVEMYSKLINWVSGEFDVYLLDMNGFC